jgi:hypothetical protein
LGFDLDYIPTMAVAMSARTKLAFNGFFCTSILASACIVLAWTAPTVWAAQAEYPSHQEISRYMSQENSRVAVIEAYTDGLKSANVREQITVLRERVASIESNLSALMKIGWATLGAVCLPLLHGLVGIFKRRERT